MEKLLVNLSFLETLVIVFSMVHGYHIKDAYLSMFTQILSKLVGKVDVEPNLFEWRNVVEKLLYGKLLEMLRKPRYNALSSRLLANVVLVSSDAFFRKNWFSAADLILTRVREKYLQPVEFELVVQLVYVYLYRNPEAWATMCGRVEDLNRQIVSMLPILFPVKADIECTQNFLQYTLCCGLKLTRFAFNEIIIPFMEVSQQVGYSELGLKRIYLAVTGYIWIVKMMQMGVDRPPFPTSTSTLVEGRIQVFTEEFFAEHVQIDMASMHLKFTSMLGLVLLYLDDNVLWSDSFYEKKTGYLVGDAMVHEAEMTIREIFDAVPELSPTFTDTRLFTMLLVKYLFYDDDGEIVCQSAHQALHRLLTTTLSTSSEEVARKWEMMFWALMSNIDASSERCFKGRRLTCLLLEELLAASGAPWKHLPEADRSAIVQEVTLKCAILSADSSLPTNRILALCREMITSLTSSPVISMYNNLLSCECDILKVTHLPLIDNLKMIICKRLHELTTLINSPREKAYFTNFSNEDSQHLLSVYTAYIQYFLRHGPINQTEAVKKKSRRVSIASAFGGSSDSIINGSGNGPQRHTFKSITGLCQLCLPLILHDAASVRSAVVKAFYSCDKKYFEEVLAALVPYSKIISDDLRNIKYRFSRRNKKSDQLKIDFTKIVGQLMVNVLPECAQHFFTSTKSKNKPLPSVQFLLKCLLEVFYFCSEIDFDKTMPVLRVNLTMMITGWARAVLNDDNCDRQSRFHFLPFKLHSEMWLTLRRWLCECSSCSSNGQLSESKHERAFSTSTTNSLSSQLALFDNTCSRGEEQEAIITAMVALCWGIQTPSPGSRQDGSSLSQFFTWTDELVELGYVEEAKEAVRRLLKSNSAVSDRLIEKCYLVRHSHYDAVICELSDSFVCEEQKEILKKFKQNIKCNLL
jgi:hypothetical protein